MEIKVSKNILLLVKVSTIVLLIGKGFLHFTSDQPYSFVFSNANSVQLVFGFILMSFGVAAFVPMALLKKSKIIYFFVIPSLIIFVHTYCSFIAAQSVIEQLVEHTLQIALPVLYIYCNTTKKIKFVQLNNALAVLVGLTFIGHGIFALGVHYLPEHFIVMTNQSLNLEDFQSSRFLFVIGILDIVLSILVFIPKVRQVAVWYLIIWGILTSLARTYYVLGDGLTMELLLVNLPNTLYRLPHGLIPIIMLLIIVKLEKRNSGRISYSGFTYMR